MTERVKIVWVYVLTAVFLIANLYLVLQKDMFWLFLLPLALIVFYFYLVSLDKIVLLITFLTPFAVNISNLEMGLGVSLPTEPMMFGVLLMFIANLIFENKYDKRLSNHPISYVIFAGLLWMLITAFTSELPLVSFKYIVSRLWFVVPFYFLAALIFRRMANIQKFFWLYLSALLVVIIYTLVVHSQYGFNEEAGHWVMSPFYNDHTAYGAALAMFVPVVIGFVFYPGKSKMSRMFAVLALFIIVAGLVFSYGRAAWLSVAVAFGVFTLVMLRIKFYWFAIATTVVIGSFVLFQQQIFDKLEKNKQDSSGNFVEHVRSMSNISSDASNLERINRWQAAIRLFDERPVFGWGPGTYQFVYAPFQRSKEKTIISTNLGDMGNAHSEYLGPLAEMGLPGMLFVILLMIFVIYTGLRVYHRGNREVKFLSLMATLGLVTYYTHGLLNNFLDSDKLSVPFWGFIAVIVALDTFHIDDEEAIPEESIPRAE